MHKTTEYHYAERVDSLYIPGLVTGADYSTESNRIFLSAHNAENAFVVEVTNFEDNYFSLGELESYFLNIESSHSIQIEGISIINSSSCFISSENSFTGISALYKLIVPPISDIHITYNPTIVFPNPSHGSISIIDNHEYVYSIYNLLGTRVFEGASLEVENKLFLPGVYHVVIESQIDQSAATFIIVR